MPIRSALSALQNSVPPDMEHLTLLQLGTMLERSEGAASVECRRQTLITIADRASRSKTHTPASRRRLKMFRAMLESEENNDEIEVTGEMFCEVLLHAMDADVK
jgi:hypothetical protein